MLLAPLKQRKAFLSTKSDGKNDQQYKSDGKYDQQCTLDPGQSELKEHSVHLPDLQN